MANSYNVVITTTRPSTSVPWAREYAFNYWGELYNESGTRLNSHPGISACLLYTSPSPRDGLLSRMPSSA